MTIIKSKEEKRGDLTTCSDHNNYKNNRIIILKEI
jgi:hypothetical protein